MNLTCNSTLEDLRILPTAEKTIVGPLTFHSLALIIAGASTLVAITMSFYLIMQHALHYTKPREQKHIIRILFMIPVYAASSFLSLRFYWHAIYFQVISDCYEAFAISSFFALLCHYMAPDLHEQKAYFRQMRPVKPWVWPLNWFKACCGGERGPWRTPMSGLTWFNIIWIGIYHYCFIRVAMTVTAVGTQYFGRYCESSNNPVFAHIWTISVNSVAVTIAMYCVIQFYVQLREPLADHKPFLKVLAIKLVIFLSFWQTAAISVGTSTLDLVHANEVIAYPDLKVGIPSLLLCFEMAVFAILHLWAFPYRPYLDTAPKTFYPAVGGGPGGGGTLPGKLNEHYARASWLGALWDAINIWDVVKAFGRGIRWLFVGVKHRHADASYQAAAGGKLDMDDLEPHHRTDPRFPGAKSTDHLPIATQFRRSTFNMLDEQQHQHHHHQPQQQGLAPAGHGDEAAGLIAHAQPPGAGDSPVRHPQPLYRDHSPAPGAFYAPPPEPEPQPPRQAGYLEVGDMGPRANPRSSLQMRVGAALWGPQGGGPSGPPR